MGCCSSDCALHALKVCSSVGVGCCSGVVIADVHAMVQALWGGAMGTILVGGWGISNVGCSLVLGATK